MNLADYLTARKLTPKQFAERIQVTRETVRRYLTGRRKPSIEAMARIKKSTKGVVTANDFYNSGAPPKV